MNRLSLIAQASNSRGSGAIPVPEGLLVFDPALSNPSAPAESGDRFWAHSGNIGFLASVNNDPSCFEIKTHESRSYYTGKIRPRVNMLDAESPNYRAEVTIYGKSNNTIVGTRSIIGLGYYFPEGSLKDTEHEISIFQHHTGSHPDHDYDYPAFYIGLAHDGQSQEDGPPAVRKQVVVINKVWESELERTLGGNHNGRRNLDLVINEGEHHFFIVDFKSGNSELEGGSPGTLTIYHKTTWGGSWSVIYSQTENNIWADSSHGGSEAGVHGHEKMMTYAHSIKTIAELEADEALNSGEGSYDVDIWMTKLKGVRLAPGDTLYSSSLVQFSTDPTR